MASCQELQIYQKETKYETIERERDMWRNILSYRHKEIAKKQTTETEKYKNYNFKPVFYSFLRWVGCEERHPRQRTPELQTFKLRHFKKKHKPILIRIFQRVICSLYWDANLFLALVGTPVSKKGFCRVKIGLIKKRNYIYIYI